VGTRRVLDFALAIVVAGASVACAEPTRPVVPPPSYGWLPGDRPLEGYGFARREPGILTLPQASFLSAKASDTFAEPAHIVIVNLQTDGQIYVKGHTLAFDPSARESSLAKLRRMLDELAAGQDRTRPVRSFRIDRMRSWEEVRDLVVKASEKPSAERFMIAVKGPVTAHEDIEGNIAFEPIADDGGPRLEVSWSGGEGMRGPVAHVGSDSYPFALAADPYEVGDSLGQANAQWASMLSRLRRDSTHELLVRSDASVPWAYLVQTVNLSIASNHDRVSVDGIPGWYSIAVPRLGPRGESELPHDLIPAVAVGLGVALGVAVALIPSRRRRDRRARAA